MVPQPSGKAIDCNSVIAGSNLAGTSKWGCGGMVDARDLKSLGSNTVRVQLPPSPPLNIGVANAPIAQLDRVSGYEPGGCEFKSCWARHQIIHRDVAQLGRVLDLGSRCRRFESCHPDHLYGSNHLLKVVFSFYKFFKKITMIISLQNKKAVCRIR